MSENLLANRALNGFHNLEWLKIVYENLFYVAMVSHAKL